MYGPGSGRIWLDNVQCDGLESDIGNCSHRGWGVHSCSHSDDVSISCVSTQTLPGNNEHSSDFQTSSSSVSSYSTFVLDKILNDYCRFSANSNDQLNPYPVIPTANPNPNLTSTLTLTVSLKMQNVTG